MAGLPEVVEHPGPGPPDASGGKALRAGISRDGIACPLRFIRQQRHDGAGQCRWGLFRHQFAITMRRDQCTCPIRHIIRDNGYAVAQSLKHCNIEAFILTRHRQHLTLRINIIQRIFEASKMDTLAKL